MASILIVDDDPTIRQLLTTLLETEGYTTTTASDGEEALTAITQELPDLILLDLNMPGMHGWRFLDELYVRGLRDQVRVIVLSALATTHAPQSIPSRRVMAKPFEIDALLDLVESTLAEQPGALMRGTERSASLLRFIEQVDDMLKR